jgi:hypothetical protein
MYVINREVYFMGDLNIDWLSSSCPLRKKRQTVTSVCNLDQVVSQPTRVVTNSTGIKSSTCIDHSFSNATDICFKAVSKSIGCSDHNIIAISRETNVAKAGANMVYKRSYNTFCSDSYVDDVKNICWSVVCNEEQPDAALDTFMKRLIPVTNKHGPIKKMTVKTVESPWIYEEFKNCMVERDEAKGMAIKSGSPTDWQTYCKLRNHVTKLNKKTNKLHYETKTDYIKNDRKKVSGHLKWNFGEKKPTLRYCY